MLFSKISVIGLGYIGLPTAAIFAENGIAVLGVDVNYDVVTKINSGGVHIIEPNLDVLVNKAVKEGRLRASVSAEPSDAFIIAVPTPLKHNSVVPNLEFVKEAALSIAPVLAPGNLIVLESTVPVGTTEKLCEWLSIERPDLTFPNLCGERSDVRIAHCPERVLPGDALHELVFNDRVVGGVTPRCSESAKELYSIFVKGRCICTSSVRHAEIIKLIENSFRDVNIAFANELSVICEELDVNVWEAISIANLHPRVNILQPGPGVGGHCIAVDPWFLVSSSPQKSKIIRTAREINDGKTVWVLDKFDQAISSLLANTLDVENKDIKVAIYGLSFKPNIDDLRESPALKIAEEIDKRHAGKVYIYEPNLRVLPSTLVNSKLCSLEFIEQADISLMLVDHREFSKLTKPGGLVIDTRGVWQ